jgi:hypothetical protein
MTDKVTVFDLDYTDFTMISLIIGDDYIDLKLISPIIKKMICADLSIMLQ